MSTLEAVRAYYDRNTRLFLRFGSSSAVQTIHRALWFDGVVDLPQALNAANDLILTEASAFGEAVRIADLGCGVGATLFYVLAQLPSSRGFGLTLSSVQAQSGGKIARARDLSGQIIEADFQYMPLAAGFDLAYAIESFAHAPEPERFLAESARILRPAGRLILLDDFRGEVAASGKRDDDWLTLYQRGWHASNLLRSDELVSLAAQHGLRLVENRLLSPDLRLRALPDALGRWLVALFKPFWKLHPIVPSMLGSLALQQCLRDQVVQYRWLVFERE